MLKKLLFLTWSITLFSQVYASVGHISLLRGIADIDRQNTIIEAKVLMDIEEKDKVFTKEETKMQITFKDDTIITLGASTSFEVEGYLLEEQNSKASFSVNKGAFKIITGKIGKLSPKSFLLKTKSSLIGIRGTIFAGEVNPNNANKDYITCIKGSIVVTSYKTDEEIVLNSGEMVIIGHDGVIENPTILYPENFSLLTSTKKTQQAVAHKNKQEARVVETGAIKIGAVDKVMQRQSQRSDQLILDKHSKDLLASPKNIQALINSNTTYNYSGKGEGTFTQTQKESGNSLISYGEIKADFGIKVDFGGNQATKLDIKNQHVTLTSATSNGVNLKPATIAKLSNHINTNSADASIEMDATTINPSQASLTSQKKINTANTTQTITINGTFDSQQATSFSGNMKQSTTISEGANSINSQIDTNIDLSRN